MCDTFQLPIPPSSWSRLRNPYLSSDPKCSNPKAQQMYVYFSGELRPYLLALAQYDEQQLSELFGIYIQILLIFGNILWRTHPKHVTLHRILIIKMHFTLSVEPKVSNLTTSQTMRRRPFLVQIKTTWRKKCLKHVKMYSHRNVELQNNYKIL